MNPPKIIKPTFTTPTLDLNYFKNNPTPVPLGTPPITSSTTQGSTPTNPVSTSTIDDQSTITDTSTTIDEENTSTDIITAMLAIYKFVNRDITTGQNVQILPADGTINDLGILLTNDSSETISITPTKYTFVTTVTISGTENDYGSGYVATYKTSGKYKITSKTIEAVNDDQGRASVVEARNKFTNDVKALTLQQYSAAQPVGDLTITPITPLKIIHETSFGGGGTTSSEEILNSENKQFVPKPNPSQVETIRNSEAPITIDNPLKDFGWNDAFKLFTYPSPAHYIRFGALLEFLLANVLIKIKKTGEPIFKIDHNEWGTYMYSLPNQISFDPRVCIVRNDHIEVGFSGKQTLAFNKLNWFREFDGPDPTKENSALTLNIYLNFDFVTECLKTDDKGNVSVYQFLLNICTGLNKALGGINNLEPVIDETNNTLRIIDTTPIPGHAAADNGPGYILQIYGYDNLGTISNFVRKIDLKTAITPEYATMITVGATAGGYVKGTEATAFSKWNTGLTDRFKEEFIPPNGTSANSNEDEAADNYAEVFIVTGYVKRYGLTSFTPNAMKFSDNIIEKNISIVTEYYKWLIAKKSLGDKPSGGTVGFIPFKLGLTLDGISGIKIYNVLRINTEFLPKAYGKTVDLIVTGVSHRLDNNDWETSIESTVMPKTGNTPLSAITVKEVRENIEENSQEYKLNSSDITKGTKSKSSLRPDPNWPPLKNVMGGDGKNSETATYKHISYWDGKVGSCKPSIDKVNPNLLKDLNTAARISGAKPIITTAITGHGAGSRHNPSGHAVDIAMFNGSGYSSSQSAKNNGIYDQIINFVNALNALGYKKNSEEGHDKAVLFFGFDNDHNNHVHISNRLRS